MIENYTDPEVEVIRFDSNDIIVTSGGCGMGGENETGEDCIVN